MLEADTDFPGSYLRDIDSMARAAFMWVRQETLQQRFAGKPLNAAEEHDLAAGFLAGLQGRFGLCDSEITMLAYIYLLMHGERTAALPWARRLVRVLPDSTAAAGYQHGLRAARRILDEGSAVNSRQHL